MFIINEADKQYFSKLLKFSSYRQVSKYTCFMSWFFICNENVCSNQTTTATMATAIKNANEPIKLIEIQEIIDMLIKNYQEPI